MSRMARMNINEPLASFPFSTRFSIFCLIRSLFFCFVYHLSLFVSFFVHVEAVAFKTSLENVLPVSAPFKVVHSFFRSVFVFFMFLDAFR